LDVDVFHLSNYDALEQVQHNSTIRRFKHSDGEVIREDRSNISLRFVFPKEMERLLSKHGFSIINVYRDWSENPITNDSKEMIYICQKI